MLAAVLNGKAARVAIDGKDTSWRELFKQREDLMTAAFLGRISYLSSSMRREALALLVDPSSATELGDIEEISFWPSLKITDGDGSRRVEPDAIIVCENGAVMIEVKPPWGQQCEKQWQNEVEALMEVVRTGKDNFFSDIKMVHFVALGQNKGLDIHKYFADFKPDGIFDFEPHQREWGEILKSIDSWAELEEKNDRSIVADWRSIFDLFGVQRPIKPLSDVCGLPRILNDSISLLIKLRKDTSKVDEHKPPSRSWRPLLSLLTKNSLEDSQCQSLLKKLALS